MTTSTLQEPDESFISSIFQHPSFKQKLKQCIREENQLALLSPYQNTEGQLSRVVEEISDLLCKNQTKEFNTYLKEFKTEVEKIYAQIDKAKDMSIFQNAKSECLQRQLLQDSNSSDEHLFDLPSIKRTITSLQEKIKEISLNSSAIFDITENKEKEEAYQDKFHSAITLVEESFCTMHQNLEETVNKRIEMQQRTINSILETLNDMNGTAKLERNPQQVKTPKVDKTSSTLSNSKSATKLKSFFGFNT